jgi:hypothetical protein
VLHVPYTLRMILNPLRAMTAFAPLALNTPLAPVHLTGRDRGAAAR